MKNSEIIRQANQKAVDKVFRLNQWGLEHTQAWAMPKNGEAQVVHVVNGLAAMADACEKNGRSIRDCYVSRELFLTLARVASGILDLDTGRIDCGTVSGMIQAIVKNEGINPDTGEDLDETA